MGPLLGAYSYTWARTEDGGDEERGAVFIQDIQFLERFGHNCLVHLVHYLRWLPTRDRCLTLSSTSMSQWLVSVDSLHHYPSISSHDDPLEKVLYDLSRGVEFLFRLGTSLKLSVAEIQYWLLYL